MEKFVIAIALLVLKREEETALPYRGSKRHQNGTRETVGENLELT